MKTLEDWIYSFIFFTIYFQLVISLPTFRAWNFTFYIGSNLGNNPVIPEV
jgi:hypothetical protein